MNKSDKNIILAIVVFIAILHFSTSCKKPNATRFSRWYVNNDRFSTNNFDLAFGKTILIMASKDRINGFDISFDIDHFPPYGNYPITNAHTQNPNYARVAFYYHSQFYIVARDVTDILICSSLNGVTTMTLPQTTFKNYNNANDTIIAHGVFVEP